MSVRVIKNVERPESKEILAEAIINIGKAADRLRASGLNQRAIIVLLHAETSIAKGTIKAVLDALPRLAGWYCK